ncbi:MAG: DNA replication and repair protein RecF [Bacteroidota bacterium]|nr:DNA replication and repair protein RecF [Bacteroidota bacterium]
MRINSLSLYQFKNHQNLNIDLNADILCISGNNGVGKTNILDAIYMVCTCKSYFNPIDYQLIHHGEKIASINASFSGNQTIDLQLIIEEGKRKKLKNNGKLYEKLLQHIGLINAVMITPDDIELIKGNSEDRRRFIDITISQTDRTYLNCLSEYQKILDQRNKQLKLFAQHQFYDEILIESYNFQLIPHGNYIHEKRQEVLDKIQTYFNQFYSIIQSGNESVKLEYLSDLKEETIENLLKSSLSKDLALQRTTQGIHKDDISFQIDRFPLKKFGSQGQNKSFIIALKLAQFKFLSEVNKTSPLLLLDDIFEKIDETRAEKLIALISTEQFEQIFITDTHPERIRKYFVNGNKSIKFVEL